MKKQNTKQLIKRQLWDSRYKVIDMEIVGIGAIYDIAVKISKDSTKVFKVKILSEKDNLTDALENLKKAKKKEIYNTVAIVKNGQKLYAGGSQIDPEFTKTFREVFK